jgi:RNA polymerase sigma factor (sigma-70 family)
MEIRELKTQLERLHEASFGWALSCCRHDREMAQDVLQTAYLKIFEGKAPYRGDSTLKTWLFAVIRRTALTEHRKALVRSLTNFAGRNSEFTSLNSESYRSGSDEPATACERREMQQRFLLALQKLPRRQRETLHLVFYQDLSLGEAAAVMGISIGSARRHYERGKKNLRVSLEDEKVNYELGWRRKENSGTVS